MVGKDGKRSVKMIYDLVIIGAGPAGITAAIYAARRKINFIIISMDLGGQTAMSSDVENYTGYHLLSGMQLIEKFQQHMKDYNINLNLREMVSNIKKVGKLFKVKTNKAKYKTKAVIIASGKQSRRLNVPGEDKLYNKGVSYCATCDAPLFKGKEVAVVGGGNSALDAALFLAKYATRVYLLSISDKLAGETVRIENVRTNKQIEVITSAKTTAILGNNSVTGLKFVQNAVKKQINVQGVFIEIGLVTNCDFAPAVKKNKWGEIMIRRSTKTMDENLTNVPGIFAAGDCTDIPTKQIIVAAGEGAKAALAAFDYLATFKGKKDSY